MKLTRGGEYALRAVLHLTQQGETKVQMVSSVAAAQEIPQRFLAKIFQVLTRAGIVASHRGVKGGFSLKRPADEITLKDVIEAVEGPVSLNRDAAGPLHHVWEEAQEQMLRALSRVTFAELARAHAHPLGMGAARPFRPRSEASVGELGAD